MQRVTSIRRSPGPDRGPKGASPRLAGPGDATRQGRRAAARRPGSRGLRARLGVALGLIAIVVSACTSATGPEPAAVDASPTATALAIVSPTPSLAPTPTPSPTPDVAKLFLARLAGMPQASMAVSAKIDVAGIPATISGRLDAVGADQFMTLTTAVGDFRRTDEQVTIAGRTYKRTGNAPWYQQPAATVGDKVLSTISGSVLSLADAGTESRGGLLLHRLVPSDSHLSPALAGLDGTGTVALLCFAKDDGTPMLLELTIDATTGTPPVRVTGTMDFTFTPGAAPTIAPPSPIFATFASTRGYAFSHPSTWVASSTDIGESFGGPRGSTVAVYAVPAGRETVASIANQTVAALRSQLKATIDSDTEGTLGGEPARILVYHYSSTGVVAFGIDTIAIHGTSAVNINWASRAGAEEADSTTFGFVQESFRFTP